MSAFKARCKSEGVSMASVVSGWMAGGQPINPQKAKTDTRGHRRKAVAQISKMLADIEDSEARYRDAIPEQFEQRYDAAEHACDQLAEAIAALEEAFQ